MASISKRGRYWRAQIVRRGYPPQYRTFDTCAEAEAMALNRSTKMLTSTGPLGFQGNSFDRWLSQNCSIASRVFSNSTQWRTLRFS